MARNEESGTPDEGGLGPGDLARLIPAAILVVALLGFGFANTESTTVDFLFTETDAPLIVVLLATAVVGAVIGALLRRRRRH